MIEISGNHDDLEYRLDSPKEEEGLNETQWSGRNLHAPR